MTATEAAAALAFNALLARAYEVGTGARTETTSRRPARRNWWSPPG
ncbi:hypothetical protein N8I84_40355 [Streptomyces cynarae]|uniref:Uncharacterized protein n=1 Tax=Streptomyces cynarae TaxID=2981134 RepID=A0ABY6EC44_9ACTN|nr:hypothetical protein [Streptomyces cynarae]UXY24234.1 hypothetical protein N8I84_40355 [Streptomyces cynarae]